jgi:hypothetical protein
MNKTHQMNQTDRACLRRANPRRSSLLTASNPILWGWYGRQEIHRLVQAATPAWSEDLAE